MSKPRSAKRFLDSLRLNVKAGAGGMGLPKYGGVGGKGGSIRVVAKEGTTLRHILTKYPDKLVKGSNGEDSRRKCIYAEPSPDVTIEVPVGIDVYDDQKRLIGTFNQEGESVIVAEGGPGGGPHSNPAFSGARGVHQVITLDLKLIADVGLVGFPNAGKSTLLKAVSRAKPKIASYPFTTIRPNLGVINYPDLRQIQIADLPGLIEGAHYNIGMGHKFLKHVERTKLLLLIADISGFQLSPQHNRRTCLETVLLLNKELELFKEELLDKPAMLIINKMDLPAAVPTLEEISPHLHDLAGYVTKVPKEMRPERLLKFDEIIPVSLKYDEAASNTVKESVRRVLDLNYEHELAESLTDKEQGILHQSQLVKPEKNFM